MRTGAVGKAVAATRRPRLAAGVGLQLRVKVFTLFQS
jgi:hypothetical protein